MLAGLVVLFCAVYVVAYLVAGDKVPRGATVAGIDIGGKSPSEATKALEDGLADRQQKAIKVTAGEQKFEIKPEAAGLGVDYDKSVAAAGGEKSLSPGRLFSYFTGGDDLDAVITVDDDHLTKTLDGVNEDAGTPAVDGDINLNGGGEIDVKEPVVGEQLDREDARQQLEEAYLDEKPTAKFTLVDDKPDVDEEDVQEALDEFANPAVSGPVTLVFDKEPVKLTPEEFSEPLGMKPEKGELVPDLDEDLLAKIVEGKVSKANKPVDATVKMVDGKPKVIPARPGVGFDQKDISDAFLTTVVKEDAERKIKVKARVAKAKFTTKEAQKLKIKEQVSTFTTYYPHADYRNTNIGRAAELVNGTLLKPGETFSLNDTVGERTKENGFTEGFIISDGIFKEDLGGGVSQMATTTFNAAFFAGLKDVEHKPHSFYIDRYPVGREATVAWGAVDLRFTNNTPYGILIDAHVQRSTPVSSGVVTVSMWSTKHWDITTETSSRYNQTSPGTRTLTTADCYPNTGYGGFDVDVTRYFRKAGSDTLVRKEVMHTTYIPSDTVICKKPGEGGRRSGNGN